MKLLTFSICILQSISVIQAAQFAFSQNGVHQKSPGPLADLSQVLEEARVRSGIPGMSVAVLHKGKLIFAEGFGKRNKYDPFTPETLTQIASVTKSFTAAAIGELVAEGKVDWDTTPLSKYLPEFELQDPILTSQLTFQDLLSHRTGFPPRDIAWLGETASRRDLIKRLKYVKTGSKLRPYVRYNNIMYAVAGEAAANVEGTSYEDLVREKILKPLGLNNTGFSTIEMSKHSNYALPHTAKSFKDAQNGNFEQVPLDTLATKDAASGDLYSNVLDLVRWGQTIMHYGIQDGKQILNRDSVVEMLSGQSIDTKERRTPEFAPILAYGMGWFLDTYKGNVVYRHSGHVPGFVTHLALLPDSELVIAHVANIGTAELTLQSFHYIADELLGLPKTQDWITMAINASRDMFDELKPDQSNFPKRIENKPASHELSEFVGNYWDPVYNEVSVYLKTSCEGKEELYLKFRIFDEKLEHYHYDSFTTNWSFSTMYIAQFCTFVTGDDGQIAGLRLLQVDSNEMEFIEFKRR
ncbi:hypothetical protein BGX27_011538 [Mortierella sp. AM989]|nr:hypothetical protein BGX27_011538 [Mortierella sp. AM989]